MYTDCVCFLLTISLSLNVTKSNEKTNKIVLKTEGRFKDGQQNKRMEGR